MFLINVLKNFEKLIVIRKTTFQIISWEFDLVWNKQDSKNQGFTVRWPNSCPLSMRWLQHKDDTIIHGKGERRVVLPVRCWLDETLILLTSFWLIRIQRCWRERGKKWEIGWAGNLDSMRNVWINKPLFNCLLPWFN